MDHGHAFCNCMLCVEVMVTTDSKCSIIFYLFPLTFFSVGGLYAYICAFLYNKENTHSKLALFLFRTFSILCNYSIMLLVHPLHYYLLDFLILLVLLPCLTNPVTDLLPLGKLVNIMRRLCGNAFMELTIDKFPFLVFKYIYYFVGHSSYLFLIRPLMDSMHSLSIKSTSFSIR